MPPSGVRSHLKRNSGRFCQTLPDMPFASCGSARRWKKMTAFDRNVFVKMLLSVSQKDDAALFPKSERSPYIQKLLEAFDKEETIDLSIIDWDAFQIENVTPENYERVYSCPFSILCTLLRSWVRMEKSFWSDIFRRFLMKRYSLSYLSPCGNISKTRRFSRRRAVLSAAGRRSVVLCDPLALAGYANDLA